ncbi:MAG: phosphoribosyltransferase [Clostridia bacterium]|nr:phosphoribosyltransferase [Clostridia bacterium]
MREINEGIVFSNDIYRILKGKNALNFNYLENGMEIPDKKDIDFLRQDFKNDVNRIFNNKVEIIEEDEMEKYVYETLEDSENLPIVSLDKIYINEQSNINNDLYFLDCTRVEGSKELVPRKEKDATAVSKQIENISSILKEKNKKDIILFDDVVFSGTVLRKIIEQFKQNDVDVIGIRACVSTEESYKYFNENLKKGLKCGCLLGKDVIDQICERDFYFGIVQSGISVHSGDGIYKAPYFKPYGNPIERASIPKKFETVFSNNCLLRSMYLWKKIEDKTGRNIYVRDLPERIVHTRKDDRLLDVLRKGMIYDEKDTDRDNGFCR